jgi:hypothetical protein
MNSEAAVTNDAAISWRAMATSLCRDHGFTVVRIVLGLLLLTAAGLKLYGVNITALPRVGRFATPQMQVLTAEWELVLALWLLSGAWQAGAWLAATATFLAFAGVSGYFGWTGVASCGCFGALRASPWTAFGVDLAALALLAMARPPLHRGSRRVPLSALTIPGTGAAILVILTVTGSVIYGSPAAALARLRGETLTVSPDYVDFGSVAVGDIVERSVDVWNWSDRPVTLIGGTSDSSCVTTADLPLVIPPGEGRAVGLRLMVRRTKPGAFTRTAELWTDHPELNTVWLRVGCRVVD